MFPDEFAFRLGYKMFFADPKKFPHESPFSSEERTKEWQRGYNAAYFDNKKENR